MSDKTTLLRAGDEAFGTLHQAIDGLSDAEMQEVWLGSWGVREILIHIAGWHEAMTPALQRIARGEAPYPPGAYDDADAWNARFVEEQRGVKAADILARLDSTYRAFVTAAGAVPEAHFEPGGAARDVFDGSGPAHHREHAAQIWEWRQAAR
jgi:Protein of unknown function (DUF1706)